MYTDLVEGQLSTKELVAITIGALEDKKGENVTVLDLTEVSPIADYFIICSGSNSRQVRSLVEEVERKIKGKINYAPRAIEGLADASWVLMDYVDFVVHVFMPEIRDFYSLERLWSDAVRVELSSLV